jgi:hypothetical protein
VVIVIVNLAIPTPGDAKEDVTVTVIETEINSHPEPNSPSNKEKYIPYSITLDSSTAPIDRQMSFFIILNYQEEIPMICKLAKRWNSSLVPGSHHGDLDGLLSPSPWAMVMVIIEKRINCLRFRCRFLNRAVWCGR